MPPGRPRKNPVKEIPARDSRPVRAAAAKAVSASVAEEGESDLHELAEPSSEISV